MIKPGVRRDGFQRTDLGYASHVGDRVTAAKNSGEHRTSAAQRGQRRRRRLSVAERREELIEAALELFSQRNPEEVSIDAVAAVAWASQALGHHYFFGTTGLDL